MPTASILSLAPFRAVTIALTQTTTAQVRSIEHRTSSPLDCTRPLCIQSCLAECRNKKQLRTMCLAVSGCSKPLWLRQLRACPQDRKARLRKAQWTTEPSRERGSCRSKTLVSLTWPAAEASGPAGRQRAPERICKPAQRRARADEQPSRGTAAETVRQPAVLCLGTYPASWIRHLRPPACSVALCSQATARE